MMDDRDEIRVALFTNPIGPAVTGSDHGHCEQCERNPYWLMADSDMLISTNTDDAVTFAVEDEKVDVDAVELERFCREFLEHRERRRAEGAAKEANRA